MADVVATNETIVVVGGGISGMTAAVEAAETGKNVILLERAASLGGRVSQLYKYFPKLCHPTCGMEINLRRLRANKRIKVLTFAEVQKVEGQAGDYKISVKIHPRFVNENCTACGACGEAGLEPGHEASGDRGLLGVASGGMAIKPDFRAVFAQHALQLDRLVRCGQGIDGFVRAEPAGATSTSACASTAWVPP
jgi:heterodisulfide reductase subunit A-like polyferredoxin